MDRVHAVVGAIITNANGELLLCRQEKWSNKWTFPGGHIEPGETITQAAVREGREETGLDLEEGPVLGWGELIGSEDFYKEAHFVFFRVLCFHTGGELQLNDEIQEARWVTPEEALGMDLAESFAEDIHIFTEWRDTHHH